MKVQLCAFVLLLLQLHWTNAFVLGAKKRLTRDEIHSEEFVRILSDAVDECNRNHGSEYWHKQETVSDATKQIVQGTNYEFNVRMRQTNCTIKAALVGGSRASDDMCHVQENTPHITCSATVWYRPWLKDNVKVTVRGTWKVSAKMFPISEIQTSIDQETVLARKLQDVVSKAVDDYNVRSNNPNLMKYLGLAGHFRESEKPGMMITEITIGETSCTRPDSTDEIEQLKKDPCYAEDKAETQICELHVNDKLDSASLENCKLVSAQVTGLWRLTRMNSSSTNNDATTQGPLKLGSSKHKPEQLSSRWSSQPLKIALLSVTRDIPSEELTSEEHQALIRGLVDAYNRRSNSLFMYTLRKVKQMRVQEEPPKTFTIKIQLQQTKCKKNEGYLEDAAKFNADCTMFDPMERVEECFMTATANSGNSDKPYKIELGNCREHSAVLQLILGGKMPMHPNEQNGVKFQDLLQRVAEQFNANPNFTLIYNVDRAENVFTQVISGEKITMDVIFKATACKMTGAADSCYDENEQHMFKCDVVVIQNQFADPKEEINITNCWGTVHKSTPVHGKWIKLSDEVVRSEEMSDLFKRTVTAYNEAAHESKESPYELNYVDKVWKQSGSKELISFKLYLKDKDNEKQKMCQVTMLSPYAGKDQIALSDCVDQEKPEMKFGAPRALTDTEFEDRKYVQMLKKAASQYNDQSNDAYYHRLDHVENPTVQVVAGLMTKFELHLQPTNCLKGKDDKHVAAENYHLCGPVNVTHMMICDASVWQKPWQNFEEIKLEDCRLQRNLVSALAIVKMGQNRSPLTKATFRQILNHVVSVFNTQSKNEVYYEKLTVENITQQIDNGHKYTFDLGLRPTKCLKYQDFVSFVNGRYAACTGTKARHVVQCKISVWSKDSPSDEEEITVESCSWIYPPAEKRESFRRLTGSDLIKPEFKMLEELAGGLFNRSIDSPVTYKVYSVENVVSHPYPGKMTTFDLYMQPLNCRPILKEGRLQTVNETHCNLTIPLYFVSCQVKAWQRPWLKESTLIVVDNCRLIHKNESLLHLGALGQVDKRGVNMTYVDELVSRFIQMFNRKVNATFEYVKQKVENVQQQIVAGKKMTFDLYMIPVPESFNCSTLNNTDVYCPSENHFYMCKASVWKRAWLNSEVLNLDKCMLVETPKNIPLIGEPQPLDVKKPNPKLTDIMERAMKLYNEQLATDFFFGNGKITDATEQVVEGSQTKFNLQMEPVGCKRRANRNACDFGQSRVRVKCDVIFWERPWLEESEKIAIENCRRYFDDGTVANHEVRLSREEEQSEEFKMMTEQLAGLYKQNVPIIYSVEKILNARVKHDKVRNITFNMILKPSGCNKSQPLSDEPECVHWEKQDQVSCEGQISEHPDGYRTMSIRNCRALWKTEAERELSPEEQQTKWFRQSVRDAIKLFQSSTKSQNLFKLRSIESATLKRSDIELVKYNMNLFQTHCVKGEDEDKIWQDDECPEMEPEVLQTCSVELKRTPDHSHNVTISC